MEQDKSCEKEYAEATVNAAPDCSDRAGEMQSDASTSEICSRKKKRGKKFRLLWGAVALVLVVLAVISVIRYVGYKKAQDRAIEITMEATTQFDSYADDRALLLEKIYAYYDRDYDDFYNPVLYQTYTRMYGYSAAMAEADANDRANARAAAASMLEMRQAFSTLMELEGYDYGCTVYFKYASWIDYTIDSGIRLLLYVWCAMVILLLAVNLFYVKDMQKQMILDGDKITCKKGKKTKKVFSVGDVQSVEYASSDSLRIYGCNIKYQIKHLENAEELYTALNERRERNSG